MPYWFNIQKIPAFAPQFLNLKKNPQQQQQQNKKMYYLCGVKIKWLFFFLKVIVNY